MQRLLLLSLALSALGSEEASGEYVTTADDDLSTEEIVLYSVLGLVCLFGVVIIIGRWCMARDIVQVPTYEPTNRYWLGRVWRANVPWTLVDGSRV